MAVLYGRAGRLRPQTAVSGPGRYYSYNTCGSPNTFTGGSEATPAPLARRAAAAALLKVKPGWCRLHRGDVRAPAHGPQGQDGELRPVHGDRGRARASGARTSRLHQGLPDQGLVSVRRLLVQLPFSAVDEPTLQVPHDAQLGLGSIVALYCRSSTLYHMHLHNRYLFF